MSGRASRVTSGDGVSCCFRCTPDPAGSSRFRVSARLRGDNDPGTSVIYFAIDLAARWEEKKIARTYEAGPFAGASCRPSPPIGQITVIVKSANHSLVTLINRTICLRSDPRFIRQFYSFEETGFTQPLLSPATLRTNVFSQTLELELVLALQFPSARARESLKVIFAEEDIENITSFQYLDNSSRKCHEDAEGALPPIRDRRRNDVWLNPEVGRGKKGERTTKERDGEAGER